MYFVHIQVLKANYLMHLLPFFTICLNLNQFNLVDDQVKCFIGSRVDYDAKIWYGVTKPLAETVSGNLLLFRSDATFLSAVSFSSFSQKPRHKLKLVP